MAQSNDIGGPGVAASREDRGFIGFRSAVGEKRFRKRASGSDGGDFGGQRGLRLVCKDRGDMLQRVDLFVQFPVYFVIAVPDAHRDDATEEIQILISVGVPNVLILCVRNDKRFFEVVKNGREKEIPAGEDDIVFGHGKPDCSARPSRISLNGYFKIVSSKRATKSEDKRPAKGKGPSTTVKLAIDATPLSVPTGGVARYTAELSRALAGVFPDDEFWLVSDQRYEHPGPQFPNLKCSRGPANVLERRWWLWGLQGTISRLAIDVFHGTDFAVPYLPLRPSVMTLHDLSPWLDPSWHADADRVRRRTPVLIRLGRATMIVTPSEAIRRAAMDRFRIQAARIVAVPLGVSGWFHPVVTSGSRKPYFLYVGTLEPRKNLGMLLDAWRAARKEIDADLVLAGRIRDDFKEVAPEPGLHVLGQVEESALPELYSAAIACVYPSLYEGFGLPVLEAMKCGAAAIASRDPAIQEVAGEAALCLDATDTKAWMEALKHAATDAEWRKAMAAKALARAAEFSWEQTAKRTREVYVEAVHRFRRRR